MINSLVNIGYVVTLLTGGILATFIIENTRLSRTKVRKIFEMISN